MADGRRAFQILVLNQISEPGPDALAGGALRASARTSTDPDAILVRSHDMHAMRRFPPSVQAIGRAGAGTNNIPVAAMSAARRAGVQRAGRQRQRGEGAGARRHAAGGAQPRAGAALRRRPRRRRRPTSTSAVEDGKKHFAGFELPRRTLGIVGLGKIGSLVADAAIKLGMNVLGYDPDITVDAAWSLPSQVRKAHSVDEVLKQRDFVTLHVPLVDGDAPPGQRRATSALMQPGAVLLNFSRDGVVDDAAVLRGAATRQRLELLRRATFPSAALHGAPARGRAAAPGRLDRARPRRTAR